MRTLNPDVIVLEIEVTQDTAKELAGVIEEHLWDTQEGMRIILGAGLGALKAERILEKEANSNQEKIRLLTQILTRTEGKLAGVRFRLSEITQDLYRWELSNGATREMAADLEKVIRRQNQDIDTLKKTLQEKDAEIEQLRTLLGTEQGNGHEAPTGLQIDSVGKNRFWDRFKSKS